MKTKPKNPHRPTVKVKPRSYQPTKAELREYRTPMKANPDRVAHAVASLFNVKETDNPE